MGIQKDPRDDYTPEQVAEVTGVALTDIHAGERGVCSIDGMPWYEWFEDVMEEKKL